MARRPRPLDSATTKKQISELDALVRAGQIPKVRELFSTLDRATLPRESLLAYAGLARRVELPDLALMILSPVVRPPRPLAEPATEDEKAEYAASLVKLGTYPEALNLLKSLDVDACPNALLYEAYAEIAVWSYKDAARNLKRYLAHPKAESYWSTVARVNLASCLVAERETQEAGKLLEDLLQETAEQKLTLLNGHLHELKAQNLIHQKDWTGARSFLKIAEEKLAKTDSRFAVFVTKWMAVTDLLEKGATPAGLQGLSQVRAEAVTKTHWETVRDCDRIRALITHDIQLATRIFFGTPYHSFRAKLKEAWGERLELPSAYEWGEGKVNSQHKILDLAGMRTLKEGSVLHKLLTVLSSDFYRPFRVAGIFSAVYPGEFFNPASSVLKVHQIISRLRSWLKTEGFAIRIEEAQAFYRLELSPTATIRMRNPELPAGDPLLELLQTKFPRGPFTTQQVADCLEISASSALRVLKKWLEEGHLVKRGTGKRVAYDWAPHPARASYQVA